MSKRITDMRLHKPHYTTRQVEMMLWLDDTDAHHHSEYASRRWGPRFRIVLHPLFDANVVDSGIYTGRSGPVYYHLTPEGMDDIEILRKRLGVPEQ